MGLKTFSMSFKDKNPEEVALHNILIQKTSPMAFAKDVLIEVLVRGKQYQHEGKKAKENSIGSELDDILSL